MRDYVKTVTAEDGCTAWPFFRNPRTGRALAHNPRLMRQEMAGRITWELLHQQPFPKDKEARHLCGNGHLGCANPYHVVPGTTAENASDRSAMFRQHGEQNSQALMTAEQVVLGLTRIAAGEEIKAVAADLGVGHDGLLSAWHGKTWMHVEAPRRGRVVMRRCLGCGTEFLFTGTRRRFCSEACRLRQRYI
jgi:hypothetical protein